MNVVLIVLLLAMVIVMWRRNQAPEATRLAMVVLLVLTVLTLGWRFIKGEPTPAERALAAEHLFEEAIAYRLGQAVAHGVSSGSNLLIIVEGGTGERALQSHAALLAGLERGLGRKYHIQVAGQGVRAANAGYREMESGLFGDPFITEKGFLKHLANHPGVDAVVSFAGAPYFQRRMDPQTLPPLYVWSGLEEDISRQMWDQGVITALVALRPSVDIDWAALPRRGQGLEDIFNMRYQLLQ